MLTAIIVDDEVKCCETLNILLKHYCPDVRVVAICNSGAEALKEIIAQQPQLVFLDVEMPYMNGFELLEKLPHVNFELIFTTSYDQYAIKAIRFSALDYLLKPIDREELVRAVDKATQKKQQVFPLQLEVLLQKLHHPPSSILKIAVPTIDGLQMIGVDNIISWNQTVIILLFFSRIIKDSLHRAP